MDISKIPKEYIEVAKYLQKNMKTRNGVLNKKKTKFFKGQSALNCLLRLNYKSKTRPPIQCINDADVIMTKLLKYGIIKRVERKPCSKQLNSIENQSFHYGLYYIWVYKNNAKRTRNVFLTYTLVLLFLFITLTTHWPKYIFEHDNLYRLVLGLARLLAVFFVIVILFILLRGLVYLFTSKLLKRGVLILPNLFADCSPKEIFVPWIQFSEKKLEKK